MDTNIANYDLDDLYSIYKVSPDADINIIYDKTITTIKRLKDNQEMEETEKQDLYVFFKECFYKICSIRAVPIEEYMKKNLQINTKPLPTLQQQSRENIYNEKITHPREYPGSLPEPISNTYSVNVNTDKYVRGTVNPIKRETIKNIFTISSKFRETPEYTKTTDFTIDINNVYHNVVSLKLASMELMNGYYPFSQYLNTNSFSIETYLIETATGIISNNYEKEIVIPAGSYITATLEATLNALFVAAPQLAMVTCEYNAVKGKLYFRLDPAIPAPVGFTHGFNLYFYILEDMGRPLYLNMGWLMGYRKAVYIFEDDYISTTMTTTNLEIGFNPEALTEVTGTKFFMLEVDDYNKNNPEVFKYNLDSKTSFNINNVLAKIPNTSEPFAIIFEDSSDKIFKARKYFGPVRISKLHIRLLDENGRVIDLNNSEIYISLEIETLEVPYKNMIYQ